MFLFMTATVVAVVIFLCGVMVGRGVPAQRAGTVMAAEGADPTIPDDTRADCRRCRRDAGSRCESFRLASAASD